MSVLSNVDIEYELSKAKNIFIYPLDVENLKGSTYNFKASKLAWSLDTKNSLVENGIIIIPKNDSALIVTEEVISVSNKIAGTYHSKVSLVKKGLGHIGTTLDPTWRGHSIISVHNHSNNAVKINVGDTFATLMLYYVNKPSDHKQDNSPNQITQLSDFKVLTEEEKTFFEQSWNSSFQGLKEEFVKQDSYKKLRKKYSKPKKIKNLIIFLSIFLIFWFIVSGIFSHYSSFSYWKGFWLLTITVGFSGVILLLIPYILRQFKGD